MKESTINRIAEAVVRALDRRLATLESLSDAINRKVTFIERQYDNDVMARPEAVKLKGVRLKQFESLCSYVKAHPDRTVADAARHALRTVQGSGGYSSVKALSRYASQHPHSL